MRFNVSCYLIDYARRLRAERDTKTNGNLFESDRRWQGFLGEWYGIKNLPYIKDNNVGDWRSKHDGTFIPTQEKTDFKTINGDFQWRDGFDYLIDSHQIDLNGYDLLILWHYWRKQQEITLLGWITINDFKEKAELVPKGSPVFSSNGTLRFKTQVSNYKLFWKDIKPMSLLETRL